MDRVSGEFKRWTQAAAFAVALAAAVFFNVDSIRVGEALWEHPAIADQLYRAQQPQSPQPDTDRSVRACSIDQFRRRREKGDWPNIKSLLDAGLPIGWPSGHVFDISDGHGVPTYIWTSQTFGQSLVGWLITAFATLFGAPFWFDALQSGHPPQRSGPESGRQGNEASRLKLAKSARQN